MLQVYARPTAESIAAKLGLTGPWANGLGAVLERGRAFLFAGGGSKGRPRQSGLLPR